MRTFPARALSAARPGLVVGLATLAALSPAGGGAEADGIVVESSSPTYQVTDRIATGSLVEIEEGELVVILDQTGDVHRIAAPGAVYDDGGQSRAATTRTGADVLGGAATIAGSIIDGVGEREELGAVRAPRTCGGPAVAPNASVACARNAPAAHLEAALLDGDALRAGEPLRYSLTATVDLETVCEVGASDGSWRAADGSSAARPVRLQPNKTLVVSRSGAPRAQAGVSLLRCYGVDPATWRILAPHVPRDARSQLVRAMAFEFAELRGGVFLETAVAFNPAR